MTSSDLPDERTFAIIGAALEVHHTLGTGFLERVYQLALGNEFLSRGIPYEAERELPIHYKGNQLACGYRLDFLCFGSIVVETKAVRATGAIEVAQVLNYLKAGNFKVGLLLNFGGTELEIRRIGLTPELRRAKWVAGLPPT
jgi:GxxExxY protein